MELTNLITLLKRQVNSPRTSSMGRLFDAVACLCGLAPVISFEGEAAMDLEFAVDEDEAAAYPLDEIDGDDTPIADWEPLVRAVLEDRRSGLGVERISARFHNGIVNWTAKVAGRSDGATVVLSGGCFQNAVLATRIVERLSNQGLEVYTQKRVPPGDGALSLGQLAIARKTLAARSRVEAS